MIASVMPGLWTFTNSQRPSGLKVAPANSLEEKSPVMPGKIIDSSKAALPGVTVTATSKDTGATREAVTDVDGSYAITNLGPGTYTVTAELAGSRPSAAT